VNPCRDTTAMHGWGKSDRPIVPVKPANKGRPAPLGGAGGGRGLGQRECLTAKQVDRTQCRIGTGLPVPKTCPMSRRAAHVTATRRGASDPRQEPGAVVPHAGIRAGGGGQPPSLPRPPP
jgi:hypothetical protein